MYANNIFFAIFIGVYMALVCRSMHFPIAVNAPQAMAESCVMKLKNSLTLASHLSVNMGNVGFQVWRRPIVSATLVTPETAVIKVNHLKIKKKNTLVVCNTVYV